MNRVSSLGFVALFGLAAGVGCASDPAPVDSGAGDVVDAAVARDVVTPPSDMVTAVDVAIDAPPRDVVAAPTCTDGQRNGTETDVDCGGSCPRCGMGRTCGGPTDCADPLTCVGGGCYAVSCADGVQNGMETDTDCGGSSCPRCATGRRCQAPTDCVSAACAMNACAAR